MRPLQHRLPWLALAALVLAPVATPVATRAQEAITRQKLNIYAGPLFRDFLGCINCDMYEPTSVWNDYSSFGWGNSYIEMSHFHIYYESHGIYSACDPFATTPPHILDPQNRLHNTLNVSKTQALSVCGPHGDKALCNKLSSMCEERHNPTLE